MTGVYSTKLFNTKMVANNAYITVGDPYQNPQENPFRQPKKGEKAPTPFQVKMKPINEENGMFSKLTYQPEGFKETIKYMTTQPLDSRKLGFVSKDASKRDEFANYIRTCQYRETIIKEKAVMQGVDTVELERLLADRSKKDSEKTLSSTSSLYTEGVPQYDIGRNRITPFDAKGTKDRFYKFDDERPKRFGETSKPASYDIGALAWETQYKPPSHGGKSEVRNFFDKSHLNVHSY